jgi:hypothetical protein
MCEYIPRLIERKKWKRPQRNLAVGDVVFIVLPNPIRNTWPLGRIVCVETGVDGIVRSAEVEVTRAHPGKRNRKEPHDVKTTVTRYIRPVNKICLLEADDPEGPAM